MEARGTNLTQVIEGEKEFWVVVVGGLKTNIFRLWSRLMAYRHSHGACLSETGENE